MKSILRFLVFVAFMGAVVAVIFLWRASHPSEEIEVPEIHSKLPGLANLDREFVSLVNSTVPSVVSINAIPMDSSSPRDRVLRMLLGVKQSGELPPQMGSGIIVSEEGHIVTNNHVIAKAREVEVFLHDGRSVPARFIGADPISDVAILKIEAPGLKPLPFGNSDNVAVGQMVFAVGNPYGLQETVTQGIISAKGRYTMSESGNELFQTDAAINPGNSGGPLIDLNGEIIGINNSVLPAAQGVGFAIPANTVRRVFEGIRDHGRFIRPWFGVTMIPITPQIASQLQLPDNKGALVANILENSPAERAGLKPGDVIIEFNGRTIVNYRDLRNRVAECEPGKSVPLLVRREGREIPITAIVEPQPNL